MTEWGCRGCGRAKVWHVCSLKQNSILWWTRDRLNEGYYWEPEGRERPKNESGMDNSERLKADYCRLVVSKAAPRLAENRIDSQDRLLSYFRTSDRQIRLVSEVCGNDEWLMMKPILAVYM